MTTPPKAKLKAKVKPKSKAKPRAVAKTKQGQAAKPHGAAAKRLLVKRAPAKRRA